MDDDQMSAYCEIDIAYSLARLSGPICSNCYTRMTPQWRKGTYNNFMDKYAQLCNSCGLKFSKGQYCDYCFKIYGLSAIDKSLYYTCTDCGKMDHIDCVGDYTIESYKCVRCQRE